MGFVSKVYHTLRSVGNHPLKRNAKWRAMRDFAVAQVAVRMIPGDVCVPFPNGTRLLISPQMKGAAHFISPGLCEFDEMAFVIHFLRPDNLFADVGANVGAYTVLASGVSGAKSISFEPSPTTFAYLQGNVRLNHLEARATAINAAVGRKAGRLRLTANLGTENFVCPTGSGGESVEVEVKTLDDVFSGQAPDLIKIDVEGYETEVIHGGEQLLRNPGLQAMIVERGAVGDRYGFDENALHDFIRKAGFRPCAYVAMERNLSEVSSDALGNIIYVRDLKTVQDRVRSATAFQFAGVQI